MQNKIVRVHIVSREMDEIDDIGQSYADLSLLRQFCMKKTQIRLELGIFFLDSLRCIKIFQIKDINKPLPS